MGGIDPQSLQGLSCTRPQYEQHLAFCNRPWHCRSHQSRSCGRVRLAGGKQPSARDARGIWGLFHVASIDRRSRRRSQGLYCKTCYRTRRQKGRNPANARPVGGRTGANRGGAFDAANEYEGPALRNLFNDQDGRPVNRFRHRRREDPLALAIEDRGPRRDPAFEPGPEPGLTGEGRSTRRMTRTDVL